MTIRIPNKQLLFFETFGFVLIVYLASAKTITGINSIESNINNETIIKSSNNPRIGIKSGIRSMGLNR